MSIRVVNYERWKRVKITICVLAWLTAVACAGGLESEGTEPIPSIGGFVIAMYVCVSMLYNLIRCERNRHRHG